MKQERGRYTENETEGSPAPPNPDSSRRKARILYDDLSDLNATLLTQGSMTVGQAERVRELIEQSNRLLNRPSGLIAAAKELMGTNMVGPDAKIFQGKNIGKVPPLPADILEVLKSRCELANDGRTVAETHRLVLLPGTINDEPLTLSSLFSFASRVEPLGRVSYLRDSKEPYAHKPLNRSLWVLEYEGVAPGTFGKTDLDQVAVVGKLSDYETATVLQHLGSIVFQYLEHNECMYPDFNGRCEERWAQEYRVDAGFDSILGSGPSIHVDTYHSYKLGRAIVRKLNVWS